MSAAEWIGLGALAITALGIVVGVGTWKRSHDAEQQRWMAQTIPKIVVDCEVVSRFSKGGIMRDGKNYTLGLPDAFDPPRLIMLATVRNEGSVPVKIAQIGLYLTRIEQFIPFEGEDLSPFVRFPILPSVIPPGEPLEANIDPSEITRILKLLHAEPGDTFTIDAITPLGKPFSSRPLSAAVHLEDLAVMRASLVMPTDRIVVSPLSNKGPVTPEMMAEYRRKNEKPLPE